MIKKVLLAAAVMLASAGVAQTDEPGVIDSQRDRDHLLGTDDAQAPQGVDVQEAQRPAPPGPFVPQEIQGEPVFTEDGREVAVVDGAYHGQDGALRIVLQLHGSDELMVVTPERISRARGGDRLVLQVDDQETAGQ